MARAMESSLVKPLSVFFAERSGLAGPDLNDFRSIIANLVQALSDGHTCIELAEEQESLLRECRLVSENGNKPLVVYDSRLYLSRYFTYEQKLGRVFKELAGVEFESPDLDDLLELCFEHRQGETDWQKEAARVALSRGLCIVSGGPGTGKTTTIIRIVGLLLKRYGTSFKIALAAPTGKAAMRLTESIGAQIADLPLAKEIREALPREVTTLHRLLGVRRFSAKFKHDVSNPMIWDAVIIDEASMVDLALMSKLAESLKPGARLVLVGDKDQLASVESGSVLADCISALQNNVVELQHTFRFDRSLAQFATAVNRGEAETIAELLEDSRIRELGWANDSWLDDIGEHYLEFMKCAVDVKDEKQVPRVFELFRRFMVLCALRFGDRGVIGINRKVEAFLGRQGFDCGKTSWYYGRPILINSNDYSLGLYNGDIGICLPDLVDGTPVVWFEGPEGRYRRYSPARLVSCETVWAMTIHKSQGSEFEEVLVVLPEVENPVLCRELVYTAVTRARRRITVFADKQIVFTAINRRVRRFSGLEARLLGG